MTLHIANKEIVDGAVVYGTVCHDTTWVFICYANACTTSPSQSKFLSGPDFLNM